MSTVPTGDLPAADLHAGDLADIVGLLRLEHLEVNMFRGRAVSAESRRLYGGQVAAQALAAAGYTVAGARPHSLHAYFLRPGNSAFPVVFQVERLQDGRTFKRRRVTAIQGGDAILCLESSFTTDGTVTAEYPAPPKVPAPEDCPVYHYEGQTAPGRVNPWDLFEARPAVTEVPSGARVTAMDMWFRLKAMTATEDMIPEAVITYLSDLTLAATALRPGPGYPVGRPEVTGLTSLDHSMWFHNPADLSDWLLYAKIAPAAGAVRGLTAGQIFDRRGVAIASVAQECLTHTHGPGQAS